MNETEILAAALKIESARERSAFLAEQCQSDPKLLEQMQQMLDLEQGLKGNQIAKSSDSPATMETSVSNETLIEDRSHEIGNYSLCRLVGEGGMGSVWEAQQSTPVQRQVAIKLIKAGMDTREVIARFESERQALALMNHPNIAKVLDAGTTQNGRPYFVMEWVSGHAINEHCDQKTLDIRQRLKLFQDVCDAVQHAHLKGIIHRDIKPSNVMVSQVDQKPIVKVIDFGLAKATRQSLTNRTLQTAFGQVLGTPAYMSPEQADLSRLDVDTRTDVYSLGVLLYELLVGVPPFDFNAIAKQGYPEVIRTIREVEPPPITQRLQQVRNQASKIADVRGVDHSSLTQLLQGDLEIIVNKALEKERTRRYQTPRELADDIERYLTSQAIQARPASMVYRLKKSVQRNKTAYIALSLIATTILVGTGVSVWQAIRATKAEKDAAAQLVLTRKALDSMSSLVVDELLTKQNDVTDSMKKVLTDSLSLYEQLASLTGNDRDTRESIADANFRIGSIHQNLGIEDHGLARYTKAIELYQDLNSDFTDEPLYATRLVNSLRKIATSEIDSGRFDSAEQHLIKSDAANENLKLRFGATTEYFENRAYLQYTLASVYEKMDRDEEALKVLVSSIQRQKELIARYVAVDKSPRQSLGILASMLQQRGLSLRRLGENETARSVYREAIEILNDLKSEFPLDSSDQLRLGVLLNDLGVAFKKDGKIDEAEENYRKSLDVRLAAVEQFPNQIDHLACLGCSQLNMGNLFRVQKKQPEDSLLYYADAVDSLERVRRRNPTYSWGLNLLEATYRCRSESNIALEQYEAAQTDIERLNQVHQSRYPEDKLPIRNILRHAYVLAHRGQSDAALKIVEDLNHEVGQSHPATGKFSYFAASTIAALAKCNPELYETDEAIRLLGVAIKAGFNYCDVRELKFHDDPDFESLRDHPQYAELRKWDEMNLSELD